MLFKILSPILFLLYTTVLSSEITTDTVSLQTKKKRKITSTSIFELSVYAKPIGWGECYNAQLGYSYDILKDIGGGFGITLFGIMINKRHILNLNVNYLLTNVQYKKWATVIPPPEKTFHDEFIHSFLLKSTYELMTFSSKNIHINPFIGIGIGAGIPGSFILNAESGFAVLYNKFGIISSLFYRPFGPRYKKAFNISFGFIFRIKN